MVAASSSADGPVVPGVSESAGAERRIREMRPWLLLARLALLVVACRSVEQAANRAGVGRGAYEIQMLYGIRHGDQLRLIHQGYRVRTLIAYGSSWYPWYMRRLAERPANLFFVARNLFGRAPVAAS